MMSFSNCATLKQSFFFALGSALSLMAIRLEQTRLENEIDALERIKSTHFKKKKNIDPDAITPKFELPNYVGDTGFINGQMCSCLKQKCIEALIERSGMRRYGRKL